MREYREDAEREKDGEEEEVSQRRVLKKKVRVSVNEGEEKAPKSDDDVESTVRKPLYRKRRSFRDFAKSTVASDVMPKKQEDGIARSPKKAIKESSEGREESSDERKSSRYAKRESEAVSRDDSEGEEKEVVRRKGDLDREIVKKMKNWRKGVKREEKEKKGVEEEKSE